MVYIILNQDLTLKKRWYDTDSLMQYSIIPITLYVKIEPNDSEFSMTFVRPDGYKSSDRGLAYQGYTEVEGEFYHKYVSELRPYHTNIIPGSSATGIGYLSFTYKKIDLETNDIEDVKSSSILKLTIYRSQEPEIEEIEPPEVVEELRARITNIESLYEQLVALGIEDIDEFFEKQLRLLHYGADTPVDEQPVNGLWMDTNNGEEV